MMLPETSAIMSFSSGKKKPNSKTVVTEIHMPFSAFS